MSMVNHAAGLAASVRRAGVRYLRFGGDFQFDDRRRHSDRLLVIVAGFKDYLWPYTLARLERFAPRDFDVCITTAGVRRPELVELAARNGWSYLVSKSRRVSTAQNIAIREHPAARWICKVDEDIVVGDGCFERVLEGYRRIKDEGEFNPGYAAPVLNVNGFSYTRFLRTLGLLEDYREAFGGTPHASAGVPIYCDGRAAAWVWERSLPFDDVARRFTAQPFGFDLIPHRFSIGLIGYERALWEEIGGLSAPLDPPGLGADESYLCQSLVEKSRVMVVLHHVMAGHYSFGPQDDVMRERLPQFRAGLALPD